MSSHKSTGNKLQAAAKAMPVEDMKWRAESDLRTLQQAQEIQRDRARMKAAKCCARDQMKALAKVTGGAKRK